MKVYLTQHGEALAKESDPERPLSDKGRADVASLAQHLRASGVSVARVWHSGKTRARQTAELLAANIGKAAVVEAMEGLGPKDSGDELLRSLESMSDDLLVAGHQPFMGRCVTRLLTGREERPLVDFRPGSVACLERDQGGGWTLQWMLRPELLQKQ